MKTKLIMIGLAGLAGIAIAQDAASTTAGSTKPDPNVKATSGEALHRDELLDRCWGVDYFSESAKLNQHIAKLRKRIEANPAEPRVIETVRGVG